MSGYLLDTHLLLWVVKGHARLPDEVRAIAEDTADPVHFSAASLWEIAIKAAVRKTGFNFDPHWVWRGLVDVGFLELAVEAEHGIAAGRLPLIHRDPFDRLLVAQAAQEGLILLTVDRKLSAYGAAVRFVA